MSRILLEITNESSADLGHLDVYGESGLPYKFVWDKLLGAYTYLPKGNEEIKDLIEAMRVPSFPYRFLPVLIEGDVKSSTPVFSPPPIVKRELYEKTPLEDLLALCADCGFAPDDSENRRSVLGQLHAYFLGRAWREIEKPEAPEVAETIAPAVPPIIPKPIRRVKSLADIPPVPAHN